MAMSKLYYIDDVGAGINAPHITVGDPRLVEARDGSKYIVFDLSGVDPRGDGQLSFPVADWHDLVKLGAKVAPSLTTVTGTKK